MDTTYTFPFLENSDTVYTIRNWSEQLAGLLNNGKALYKPDTVTITAPNYTSTAAMSTPVVLTTNECQFVAKKSGAAWVNLSGLAMVAVANYNLTVYCQIRTAAGGGGTQVHQSSVAAMEAGVCYTASNWTQLRSRYLVTGLTPGTTYYARLMFTCDYSNAKVNYGTMTIEY